MKLEVLFPEISNIYGDNGNIAYLKKCIPDCQIIETNLGKRPKFLDDKIDLVYLGSMTEKMQEKAIDSLMDYKNEIKNSIQNNQAILLTGNALEVFGNYIENEDGTRKEALGITDIYAKRDMMHRFNTLVLAEFEGIKIVGFKSQFSENYGDNTKNYFAKVLRGVGINKESKLEGIRKNNLIATSLLGPILVLNPEFTKYILKNILKLENANIAFEEEAYEAYYKRLSEFEDKKRKI